MPKKGKSLTLRVDERELATILAALRFHQDENLQACPDIPDQAIRVVATDGGRLKPLDFGEVGQLCQRLNLASEPVDRETCRHDWQEADGPKTGCGDERWFQCPRCGVTKYRCVEHDASTVEEVYPPEGERCLAVPARGMTIGAPPKETGEKPLFRVVYVVDVSASDVREAAELADLMMTDPASTPPVLQVVDHRGSTVTVDLSEEEGQEKEENKP